MRLKRFQGILFDLDGVLVDSHVVVERTWQRWAERHALSIPDIVRRAHGRRSVDTLREVAPHVPLEDEVAWLAATELADTQGLIALPGALDAFGAVADNRRAVVTSGGRELARMRLRHTGLSVPEVLVAAEDVRVGKPSPEGYELAAARLGIEPSSCLVIEDTPAGISAGRAAGAAVLAIATTFPADALTEAEMVVASLTGIRIRQIGGEVELMIPSGGR